MIADTSFIIDVLRGRGEALSVLARLSKDGVKLKITAPTVFELWSGIFQARRRISEKKKVLELLSQMQIISFDQRAAQKAGEIDGTLVRQGRRIDPEDAMVAGIALVQNEILLTNNKKHFSRIPDLKIKGY